MAGKKTAFIGKVGKDSFGEMLRTAVSEQGINCMLLPLEISLVAER